MTGPIDLRIGTFGEMFRQIADPPAAKPTPVTIADGPLSRGLGGAYNEASVSAGRFLADVRRGMTDTGDILVAVSENFASIDGANADGMRKLFAPEGGR